MNKNFTPGMDVYVVEREESGEAIDFSGYMLLAVANRAVIVSSFIDDLEDLDATLEYHIQETMENYGTNLFVFPLDDCYETREEAELAVGS